MKERRDVKKLLFYKAKHGSARTDRLHLIVNSGSTVLLTVVYLSGVTFGALLFYGKVGEVLAKAAITFKTMTAGETAALFFADAAVTALFGTSCALSAFGMGFVPALPFVRGWLSGLLLSLALSQSRYKGLISFALIVLPGQTLQAVLTVVWAVYATKISKSVFENLFEGKATEKIHPKEIVLPGLFVFILNGSAVVPTLIANRIFSSLF